MRFFQKGISALLAFVLSFSASAAEIPYIFKPGDSLSKIAQKYIGSPVYPKKTGSLRKLLARNPAVANVLRVAPGTVIWIPEPNIYGGVSAAADSTAERAPAQKNSTDEASDEPHSTLTLDTQLVFSRLGATSPSIGTIAILSQPSYRAGALWSLHWSETLETYFRVSLTRFRLSPPFTGVTLNQNHFDLPEFQVGFKQNITRSTKIDVGAGGQQQLVIQSFSAQGAIVQKVFVPKFMLGLEQIFAKKGRYTLYGSGHGLLFLGAKDGTGTMGPGTGYDAQLGMKESFKKYLIHGYSFYNYRTQKGFGFTQSETQVGLGLQIGFDY